MFIGARPSVPASCGWACTSEQHVMTRQSRGRTRASSQCWACPGGLPRAANTSSWRVPVSSVQCRHSQWRVIQSQQSIVATQLELLSFDINTKYCQKAANMAFLQNTLISKLKTIIIVLTKSRYKVCNLFWRREIYFEAGIVIRVAALVPLSQVSQP